MAAEISFRDETAGTSMRATIRKDLTVGGKVQMWHTDGTPGWEDMTVANWANYILTLTETPASSYTYIGTWPTGLTTVGWYHVDIYRGTAISSVLCATLYGRWDGTNFNLNGATIAAGDGVDAAIAISSAGYQKIAKEALGVAGVVYHVAYNAGETMGNDALSWATADLTAGAGVKTDIEAAAVTDLVQLGAGTFALGTNGITQPANTRVVGAGRDSTVITSTYSSPSIFVVGAKSQLSDLTIQGTLTNGTAQIPVAITGGSYCKRLHLIDESDGFYLYGSGEATIEDCLVESKFDCLYIFATSATLKLTRVEFRSIGPSTVVGNTTTRGLHTDSSTTIYCDDSSILAKNGGGTTYGVASDGGGPGTTTTFLRNTHINVSDTGNYTVAGLYASAGDIYMFGGSIRTSNGNGTDLAVHNAGTGKIVLVGVNYDRTKTSNTSTGSIIDIPMHAADQDGATIQAAANAALVANNLDHVAGTATGIPTLPAGTWLDIARSDGTATYDRTTDSQQAIRDRGDSAWTTATGFATPTNITAGTITTVTNLTNAPTVGDFTTTMKTSAATAVDASATGAAWADGGRLDLILDTVAVDVAGLDGTTAAAIASATLNLANGVETGVTPKQALQRIGAVVGGKISGAGTGSEIFVGMDGTSTRVTVVVDSSGNRTAVTYTG